MARKIKHYKIEELANEESNNEVLIQTNPNTLLHITSEPETTTIEFPCGNRFDIIAGRIIIHKK